MDLSHAILKPKAKKPFKKSHIKSILPTKKHNFENSDNISESKNLKENMSYQNTSKINDDQEEKSFRDTSSFDLKNNLPNNPFSQKPTFVNNPILNKQKNKLQNPENLENQNLDNLNQNSKIEELEVRVRVLKQELEDWKIKALTANKAMDDLKIHQEHLLNGTVKSVKKQVATAILNFINTIFLSFSYAPKSEDLEVQKFLQTLKSNFSHSLDQLKSKQIEILIPEIGQEFDANTMSIVNPEMANDKESVFVKQVASVGLRVDNQLVQAASILI
jgi:molecular chaperone GrpE (heat shock protein)